MAISAGDAEAIALTLELASLTTAILLLLATPLAWWLSRTQFLLKPAIEALVALPLVLPPTVIGFYLLLCLGPDGPVGSLSHKLGLGGLAFSFPGLVIGSVIYSLPFVVQPLQNAFEGMGRRPLEVAASLRAGPLDRFFTVTLPLARPGFVTGMVLGFTHTLGEFGVVLMIGGSIPKQTKVLSIAIYQHVEALEYAQAHLLSGLTLIFAFLVLLILYIFNRRIQRIV